MKTLKILVLIMAAIAINTLALKAQCGGSESKNTSTEVKPGGQTYKVDGECEMCKSKIEKAALSIKGVKAANWDVKTHLMTMDISQEASLDNVFKAIADAGYDNEKFKASEKAYKALPGCCQYRK
jgi:copper chaperone CopZ